MHTCTNLILIAEDDPEDQELIAYAFFKADPSIEIHIVTNGIEVLNYLNILDSNKLPCVILLDYNMPELNGAQVIQHLSPDSRFKSIPKIILSTSDNPIFMQESFSNGANDYKVKPDNMSDLVIIAKELVILCKNAA